MEEVAERAPRLEHRHLARIPQRHTGVTSISYDDAVEETLKTDPSAWRFFEQLAPSYRRAYIGWIDSAKRQETKEKRLSEALNLLASGKKVGLK